MDKINVIFVHGGMTFKKESGYIRYLKTKEISLEKKKYWSREYLAEKLKNKFNLVSPVMPLKENARYNDWKIFFERYLALIDNGPFILIGTSLGGIFLAKYLSENKLRRTTLSVILVCPPFDDSLPGEDLSGGFKLKENLSLIEKNSGSQYLLFSDDDDVVPIDHAEKYRKKLKKAHIEIYKNKNGHFNVARFPEIIKIIEKVAKDNRIKI